MTSFRRFLVISTLLTISGLGSAQAQGVAPGDYSLAVGSAAPCGVTLAADGTTNQAPSCSTRSSNYTHWIRVPTGIQFEDNAGNVVVILKSKGDGYAGISVTDSRNVFLTPATQTAAH